MLSGAGDSGAAGYEANGSSFYSYPVTGWPASDPLVTAVGGTRLNLDSSGKRTSADTVWNDTYSKTANQLINGNNGPNPLAGGGGTSVVFSRPAYQNTVSGVADQQAGHSLGLINPALYKLAAEHAPGIVRVTTGNNTVSFRQGGRSHKVAGFSARSGYNLAAGLGTVNAAYLVPELARLAG